MFLRPSTTPLLHELVGRLDLGIIGFVDAELNSRLSIVLPGLLEIFLELRVVAIEVRISVIATLTLPPLASLASPAPSLRRELATCRTPSLMTRMLAGIPTRVLHHLVLTV